MLWCSCVMYRKYITMYIIRVSFRIWAKGGGDKMAICNLVRGMALSTCTALDNVAESSIQSITLTIHKAWIVINKYASSKGGGEQEWAYKGGGGQMLLPAPPPLKETLIMYVHTFIKAEYYFTVFVSVQVFPCSGSHHSPTHWPLLASSLDQSRYAIKY